MAGIIPEKQGLNPSLIQVNPSLELMNLDSHGPLDFMLFSNGTLLDSHHQSQFPISLNGGFGEQSKIIENESRRKRKRKKEEVGMQKPRDVVHVRAKRGEATDSHSLAERVRRGKINERLRCLQDLVPGCYKTMGMAVMLDVIINYVRSLQNQIEFLSMKLSAASLYCDLNSMEMEPIEILQGANLYDAQEIERMLKEGEGEQPSHFSSTWSL